MQTKKDSPSAAAISFWSWLIPVTYLIHIAEEYFGGEGYPAYILRIRGVHLSTTRFLVAQGVGLGLVIAGVILSRFFHFPQMMLIILSAIVLVNGITHTVTSIVVLAYGPGLFSSALIWIPVGIFTLLHFRKGMSRKRYWTAIAIGVGVNVAIGIITMRGGRIG
jgi:hypothetical protein